MNLSQVLEYYSVYVGSTTQTSVPSPPSKDRRDLRQDEDHEAKKAYVEQKPYEAKEPCVCCVRMVHVEWCVYVFFYNLYTLFLKKSFLELFHNFETGESFTSFGILFRLC